MGTYPNSRIAVASIANGRVIHQLDATKATAVTSMVALPDGQTIYYTAAGSVWSVAVAGGEPKRLGVADSVTLGPGRQDLIVRRLEKEGAGLYRMGLSGSPVERIALEGDIHVVAGGEALGPTAASKDGQLAVQLASGSAWTWPAGIVDLRTGKVRLVPVGYPADMISPGWAPDGRLVVVAEPIRSSLWRFRQTK